MRVILLGAPGSGKGTQAVLLERRLGLPKISTGDILRAAVQAATPLGLKVKDRMARGELVEDALVAALVEERVRRPECDAGYVLDGYPRTLAQARDIERMDGERSEIVLEIALPDEVLLERLSRRWVCPRCEAVTTQSRPGEIPSNLCPACKTPLAQREDDTPEVVRERLRIYQDQTRPLRDYYAGKKTHRLVDGSGGVEDVYHRIAAVVKAALASRATRQ
ncbi:MAG: adenylate kinase [Candidatus Aminicenantes bacterium]|nr:adenylate kinase [Candidatus Aminicenantes bacterium]